MNQVELKRRQIEMFSCIIGLINILVFGGMIGKNGIAYLVVAYTGFALILTLITGGLSDALGKMLRARNAKGQFKNILHTRKRVLILQGSIGLAGSILFAACANIIAGKLFDVQYSAFLMVLLAPALCLRTISAVLTGFFQGDGSALPAVVVAPLRQLMLLGFGLLFGNMLRNYGAKVSALLGDVSYTAMYGGAGVAIAINLTELLVVLFLGFMIFGNRRSLLKRGSEGMKQTDSVSGTIKILYGSMWMPMCIQLLEILPFWMGALLYRKGETNISAFAEQYGALIGSFAVICAICVLLICIMLLPYVARMVSAFRKEDIRNAKAGFQIGMRNALISALYITVFVAVMANQFAGVLGGTNQKLVAEMFRYGSILILFTVLYFYFSRILMFTGKKLHLLMGIGLTNVVFLIMVSILLFLGKVGVMSVVYGAMLALLLGAMGLGFLCCRLLHTGIEWLRSVAAPAMVVCVIGICCMIIGKLLTPHLGNLVTLFVSFVVTLVAYWFLLSKVKKFIE